MTHARMQRPFLRWGTRACIILVSLFSSLILACDMVARFASRPSVALVEMLSISSDERSSSEILNEFHEYLDECSLSEVLNEFHEYLREVVN